MREGIAKFTLFIGVIYLLMAVVVHLFTGGFEARLWGFYISLWTLEKPLLTTLGLISAGFLLSKEKLIRVIEQLNHLSDSAHRRIAYTLGILTAVYLSILKSLQHFTFQTSAYDLGIYANVAWSTAHGYFFHDSVTQINYLGDHFSPFFFLLIPIYRFWESAIVLPILQSIGIGLAAVALYLITLKHFTKEVPSSLYFSLRKGRDEG